MAYNKQLADRAVAFINSLKHTKGTWHGVPFELLPWQDKIIRDIFGTVKDNGYRQYMLRNAFGIIVENIKSISKTL